MHIVVVSGDCFRFDLGGRDRRFRNQYGAGSGPGDGVSKANQGIRV